MSLNSLLSSTEVDTLSLVAVCSASLVCVLSVAILYMATRTSQEASADGAEKLHLAPGPRRYPVVGNLLQLSGDEMFYVKLNELRKAHGDVIYLQLGAVKMLVVFGHEHVSRVLSKNNGDKFSFRPAYLCEIKSLELNKGIVWSNGEINAKLRRFAVGAVDPGLGSETLEQRVRTESDKVLAEMRQTQGDSTVLKRLFYQAICNINCSIIFGHRFEYSDSEFQELIDLMDQLLQRGGIKNPLNFFPILQKLPENKKTKHTKSILSKVSEFISKKIESSKDRLDKSNPRGLVDLYLAQDADPKSEDYVTEENLCHIVRDFFVAGTENVAVGLLWLAGYMVQYPEVQTKCRQALAQTQGTKDGPDVDCVTSSPYLEATVCEALRMANIAPLSVPHAVTEDVEYGGWLVPRDTMVLTHLQSVHMDPALWKEPDTFQPDRFIENNNLVKPEAFYPYSIGTRYCLAAKLAQMELTTIFAGLIKHFSFTADDNTSWAQLRPIQPGAFVEPAPFNLNWTET